eukprot:g45406.t1
MPRMSECPCHPPPEKEVIGFPSNRAILGGFLDILLEEITSQAYGRALTYSLTGLKEELATCHHCHEQLCQSCHLMHMEQLQWNLRSLVFQLRKSIPKLCDALRELKRRSASLKEKRQCDSIDSRLADNRSLPSTKLRQLHQQPKELIDYIRQLETSDQEQPQSLTFMPSTALYPNAISFGTSYDSGDGEFDCLAGVAISNQGWIVTADRDNHRAAALRSLGPVHLGLWPRRCQQQA